MYLNFLISISKTDDLLLTQLVTSPHEKRSRSAGWLIVVPLIVALSAFAFEDSLPPIFANQNHASAGALRDGILTIQLEIAKTSGIRRLSTALLFPFMRSQLQPSRRSSGKKSTPFLLIETSIPNSLC